MQQRCNKVATKSQHSCNKVATTLQQSCNKVATNTLQLCCIFQHSCNKVATCELQCCCKLHQSCNNVATHMLQFCCSSDTTCNKVATRMLQLLWNLQRKYNEESAPHGSACLQNMQRYVCGYHQGILITASVQPPCSSLHSVLYNYDVDTAVSTRAMQLRQHIKNGVLNGSDYGFES